MDKKPYPRAGMSITDRLAVRIAQAAKKQQRERSTDAANSISAAVQDPPGSGFQVKSPRMLNT